METKKEQISTFIQRNPNQFTANQIAQRLNTSLKMVYRTANTLGIRDYVRKPEYKRRCPQSGFINVVRVNSTTLGAHLPVSLVREYPNVTQFSWRRENKRVIIEPVE